MANIGPQAHVRKVILIKMSPKLIGKMKKTATAGTPFLFQTVSHQQQDLLKGVILSGNLLTEAKRGACQGITRAGGPNLQQYRCNHKSRGTKGHAEDQ